MTAVLLALALPLSAAPKAAAPAAPVEAAAAKTKRPAKVLAGNDVELKTKDGWTIAAKYLPAQLPKPTVILLHETGGRKENWYTMGRAMAKRGIGFLALDFRGHGASQSPPAGQPANWRKFPAPTKAQNEWNNLALDVDAAVEYLATQNVPIASIGVGGADVGSSIGLKYAAVHNQIPFLFMLSPGMSYREILTVNAIRAYTKRPILLVVGADDNRSTRETAILYEFAKRSAGAENTQLITAEREHGTRILVVNKDITGQILDWVENPTQSLEVPVESTGTPAGTTGPETLPSDEQLLQPAPGESTPE